MRRVAASAEALAVVAVLFLVGGCAVTVEKAEYNVVLKDGRFQVRDYKPQVVAETVVKGSHSDAGNKAFRTLFRYISGNNRKQTRIAMTAPVSQEVVSEKIAMTAPVGQRAEGDGWAVSFMMPATYTMETLPEPEDPAVVLRAVPARRMATVRYSGSWSTKRYREFEGKLREWMTARELRAQGDPVWARYNAPFTLPMLRRNEILIEVGKDKG
jgi:hypothetical protein